MPVEFPDTSKEKSGEPAVHDAVLVCPFEDWPPHGGNLFTVAILVPFLVGVMIVLIMYFNTVFPTGTDSFVWITIFVMLAGSAVIYHFTRIMKHPTILLEILRFRTGNLASRFRARFLIAEIRGRDSRARLALWWRGPRCVLVGLNPDPELLARVQVFEPIDISGSPREYSKKRPVRYRDIHITALIMAYAGAFFAESLQRGSMQYWSFWFIPMLPLAWISVWWFRRSHTSSILAWMPIQVISTVVEPGRVTRTVLGVTRVFDASTSLLLIRPNARSAKDLALASPRTLQVRVTMINSKGQRSSFKVLGADHPTLADLIVRWTYPATRGTGTVGDPAQAVASSPVGPMGVR